jgi:hypothetical protein
VGKPTHPKPVSIFDPYFQDSQISSGKSNPRVSNLSWYIDLIRQKKFHENNPNLEVRKETGSLWTPDVAIAYFLPTSAQVVAKSPNQVSPAATKQAYVFSDLVSHPKVEMSPKTTYKLELNSQNGVSLDYGPAYQIVSRTPKQKGVEPLAPHPPRQRGAARTPVMKRDLLSAKYQFTPCKEVIDKFEPSAGVRVVMDPYGRKETPAIPQSRYKMSKSTFERR